MDGKDNRTTSSAQRKKHFISLNTKFFSHPKLQLIFANAVRENIGDKKSPIPNFKQ
jgi:hypothetical protein